ncbi:MAG TPA: RecQ family ATP-dependent DNA helicase [Candidatus Dormibacteraeota bacterium]|nr:RecQ family ATP-dependent DNA helicase [Candidatus Dormibacteraeota bacterium]
MQREKAVQLLREMLGAEANFRPGQWEAIDLAANQRQRVLVVQRTGWGKSVVYFLAAKILRDSGSGPALLISPLLSLMRNQILAANRLGIRAVTIHSENVRDWSQIEEALKANEVDLLMISPERLANAAFLDKLLPVLQGSLGMFVVDEAHCISDWGHDFRPDYRRIIRILRLLPPNVPVLCTTATANDRVVQDIESQIVGLKILRGPLVRRSLKLFNIKLQSQAERLAWLAQFLPTLPGNGIIYTLTVQDSRRVAGWLQQRGIVARAYHADLDGGERVEAEQQLLDNKVKALVATVALGMGFDKPDLGFVIHFQRPGSVVAYYQQVGRAGRAVDSAYGILLSGREDDQIQEYFIRTAFPPAEVMEEAVRILKKVEGITVDELGAELNHSRGTLEKALKLLEVDGAVQRHDRIYSRTANRWKPELMRAEQVTQHRRTELEEIKRYVEHEGCLMEFLSKALDDPGAAACGKCMNCTGKRKRQAIAPEIVQAAVEFLRSDELVIEPRRRWPGPLLPELNKLLPDTLERFDNGRPKTVIPERLSAQPGRALCIYGDAGWGEDVERGKYRSGRFSEDLVTAASALVREKWKPNPFPAWVTTVPSQRHSELVLDFGQRLAASLGLPFVMVLRKRGNTPAQKQMQNSPMQLRNLLNTMEVAVPAPNDHGGPGFLERMGQKLGFLASARQQLSPRPVLLVDDVIDSGWTLTMAAILLQQCGSGPVFPFALARASLRGG